MQIIGQALAEIASLMPSPSEPHTCEFCNQVVPKFPLKIGGKTIMIQPLCKCEVENWEKGMTEAIEKKKKNEIERKFSISVLGERFDECRFETFTQRTGSEKAVKLAKIYAQSFPDFGGEALLIWGDPGTGKSHLAAAVCHTLKDRGFMPVFQSVPDLLARIRSTFRKQNAETEQSIMTALLECDLLVLDDIGAEKVTDWVLETIFRIIDGRYRAKKPIFYTTNFSPSDLLKRFMPDKSEREDEIKAARIHDRIIGMSVIVENKALSYRRETAKDRIKEMEDDDRPDKWYR